MHNTDPETIVNPGADSRVLYMTECQKTLKEQLQGKTLNYDSSLPLLNNISTDEITPGWACFWYDETLANFVYRGLRSPVFNDGDFAAFRPDVLVSGLSKGCGSSREHAPYAEKVAGVKIIVAKSLEKIYEQNCRNIGLLTTTDFSILNLIESGSPVPLSFFLKGLNEVNRDIVLSGGLLPYSRRRLAGSLPLSEKKKRADTPQTLVEKIISRHVITDPATGATGVSSVEPGETVFCRTDVRFSHEYVTAMAKSLYEEAFGFDTKVKDPESVFVFRDHLSLLSSVMSDNLKEKGCLKQASRLAIIQKEFASKHSLTLYGEVREGGSEAICHNAILEDIGLPSQLIIGTDSHTCTAGALGCFAFGVGTTDIANSWFTKDVQVKVPETVRIELKNTLKPDTTAKDLMLFILSLPYIKEGHGIGKVLEFAGDGLACLNVDERATLTNLAVEAGAFTGIVAPDQLTIDYIRKNRPKISEAMLKDTLMTSDPDANFDHTIEVDLSSIGPFIALPGDPRNGVQAWEHLINKPDGIKIDIAYGGSCTGGKPSDMDMYAKVLSNGLRNGMKVPEHVSFYIQCGSQKVKKYVEDQGYDKVFQAAGARLINPSCGACINAGPGVSKNKDQVTVSAINRNFNGRSGPGQVYLGSPYVVAASALAGQITTPQILFREGSGFSQTKDF